MTKLHSKPKVLRALTDDQIAEAARLYDEDPSLSLRALAKRFGVSRNAIVRALLPETAERQRVRERQRKRQARLEAGIRPRIRPRNTCRGEAGTDAMLAMIDSDLLARCEDSPGWAADEIERLRSLIEVMRALLEKARGKG